jgi:hypothetical protein
VLEGVARTPPGSRLCGPPKPTRGISTGFQAKMAPEGPLNGMVPETKRKVSELLLGWAQNSWVGGRVVLPGGLLSPTGLGEPPTLPVLHWECCTPVLVAQS